MSQEQRINELEETVEYLATSEGMFRQELSNLTKIVSEMVLEYTKKFKELETK